MRIAVLVVDVESRVWPVEHALSRLDIQQLAFHEHLEHRATERLGQCGDVVEGQLDEGAVRVAVCVSSESRPTDSRSIAPDCQ